MTVHPLLRRAGRVFGWGLLGLVLVLTLALAGGFVFLRSQPGERWIADTVVSALHGAGIDARVGALEGPLPFTLRLRGFQLADAKGVWLDVPEATHRVGPAALLRGHLLVEELSGRWENFCRRDAKLEEKARSCLAAQGLDPGEICCNLDRENRLLMECEINPL